MTTHADIAITGIGVLTPLGDTLTSLIAALNAGECALVPATEPALAGVTESRIADFDATRYANVRGMRIYNRTTRMAIAATKLALTDARLDGEGAVPSEDLGLVMASTFGHLDTLVEYDRSLVTAGLQRTNPALMPLGLPSAPGAAVSLSFVAKAFSITLADDAASSLDALGLGARLLAGGRARVCVVVAAFAPFLELSLAASRAGLLATHAPVRVFDRRHCGTALGESAVALVLERATEARARGAAAHGFIAGQASTFATDKAGLDGSLGRACDGALAAAGIDAGRLALVSAGANGSAILDTAEAHALTHVLGAAAGHLPVIAVKANLGDPLDAGGLAQAAIALSILRAGKTAPAILGLEEPAVPGLHYAHRESPVSGSHTLVTSISSTGACSALILSRGDATGGI